MKRKSKGEALEGWQNFWGKSNAHEEYACLLAKKEATNSLTRGEWYRYFHLQRELSKRSTNE